MLLNVFCSPWYDTLSRRLEGFNWNGFIFLCQTFEHWNFELQELRHLNVSWMGSAIQHVGGQNKWIRKWKVAKMWSIKHHSFHVCLCMAEWNASRRLIEVFYGFKIYWQASRAAKDFTLRVIFSQNPRCQVWFNSWMSLIKIAKRHAATWSEHIWLISVNVDAVYKASPCQ